ncbi:hypothetical protein GIB67_005771 [Kingdonia uniflora]|uniref:Uncharacterized protein n=1 Tax=Kingdonia uniflora TaxID=39325 RepID=A0A7J7KVH9_9MAGN|nr:hypothetical protein GIB67_005771 [Kingdonia uniflora]
MYGFEKSYKDWIYHGDPFGGVCSNIMRDDMPDHDMHYESNVHANMTDQEGMGIGGARNAGNDEEPREEDTMESIMTNKRTHKCMEDVVAYDMVRLKRTEENNARMDALGLGRIATGMSLSHQKKSKPNGRKNGNKKVVEEEYRPLFQLEDEYLSEDKDDEDLVSESDEPLETDNAVGIIEGSSSYNKANKNGRGYAKPWSKWDNGKIKILEWNEDCQPLGPNEPKLMSHLGNLARNGAMFPLTMLSWKVASNTSLDGI